MSISALSPSLGSANSFATSHNGKWCALSDQGKVRVINASRLTTQHEFEVDTDAELEFSPNSRYLLARSLYRFTLFNTRSGAVTDSNVKLKLIGQTWSPNSRSFIVCSELGVISIVCDVSGRQSPVQGTAHAYSINGRWLCITHFRHTTVFDTESWTIVTILRFSQTPSAMKFVSESSIAHCDVNGRFTVTTLYGAELYSEVRQMPARFQALQLVNSYKLVAPTYNNIILIYDILSWKAFELEYPTQCDALVGSGSFKQELGLEKMIFQRKSLVLKFPANYTVDFELKSKSKFHCEAVDCGYLATVNPALPHVLWVWSSLKWQLVDVLVLSSKQWITDVFWLVSGKLLAKFPNGFIVWDKRSAVQYNGVTDVKWVSSSSPVVLINFKGQFKLGFLKDFI